MVPLLTLMTLLLTFSGGLLSIVNITSETVINGTIGGSVNITWKVRALESPIPLFIYVNNTLAKNRLFRNRFYYRMSQFSIVRSKEFMQRSTAAFYHTGNWSMGRIVEGEVVLTIRNLQLTDSNEYILTPNYGHFYWVPESYATTTTILSVNFGPEKCGLATVYMVNHGRDLVVTAGSCGKPQPIVTCKFHGRTYSSVNVTEINQYNYTYIFVIPTNMKPCEQKQLSCTTTGHEKPVTEHTTVIGNSVPDFGESFIENIKQYPNNCTNITWENNGLIEKCNTTYQVDFFDTYFQVQSVNVTNTFLNVCKGQDIIEGAKYFRIITYVYGLNGTMRWVRRQVSTDRTLTTEDKKQPVSKSFRDPTSVKTAVINALTGIIAMLLVADLLLVFMVKSGKVTVKWTQKKNSNSFSIDNRQSKDNVHETNTSEKPPSDYMELQAARKDATYQTLTSVQSTLDTKKDNFRYECYYNNI